MKHKFTTAELRNLIETARGKRKCDLVVRGGYVVNVFTGEILRADVGISGGYIALVGNEGEVIEAEHVVNAENLFLVPGFIDSHIHLESSMLTPSEFTRSALPLGTTAVVIDPHEMANVVGAEGIRELIEASEGLPLTFYITISPAVPSSDIDTSGGRLDADDIAKFADYPRVLGIAEAMDFPGVLEAKAEMLEKLMSMPGKVIDGHAPNVGGYDLQAYAAAGITSDHETTNTWEGLEKLRAGMYLMIREGSAACNLDDLINLVNPRTADRCLLVSDDVLPTDIEELGYIDHLLRKTVQHGVSPVQAIRMVTLNAAQRFKLDRVGAVAPGYVADLVALEDLAEFKAAFVIAKGEVVAMDGEMIVPVQDYQFSRKLTDTVHLPDLDVDDLVIPMGEGYARVIEAVENQIFTKQLFIEPVSIADHVVSDIENDVLKIAVVERHGKSGNIGLGLVKGFNLKKGAIAGSVAHDSHNIVAVGVSDVDILRAIQRIGQMNGGLVVVSDGEVLADLPLPVGGLMSQDSASIVAGRLRLLERAVQELGCAMKHPLATLSFMCLPVIPELKITDVGLVDVNTFEIVPLFAKECGKAEDVACG